jgi:DNA-directed RNA polymerase subunit RPC12/RpoP
MKPQCDEELDMQEQVDHNYRFRGWGIKAPLWLLTLLTFAIVAYKAWRRSEWDWLGIAVFVGLVVAGLGFEAWLQRAYRCPRCGLRLGAPRVQPEEGRSEYVYDCAACGITWRTRTYVPTGE